MVYGHVHQIQYNQIGNISFHAVMATAWPWPYPQSYAQAESHMPKLTVPMNRADPFFERDATGWQFIDLETGRVAMDYNLYNNTNRTVAYNPKTGQPEDTQFQDAGEPDPAADPLLGGGAMTKKTRLGRMRRGRRRAGRGRRVGSQADEFTEEDVERWQGEYMSVVEEGRALWGSPELGTNGVACAQCHPNAANTHPETYPKFQQQLGRVIALARHDQLVPHEPARGRDRWRSTIRQMIALEAYVTYERRGVALDPGKH